MSTSTALKYHATPSSIMSALRFLSILTFVVSCMIFIWQYMLNRELFASSESLQNSRLETEEGLFQGNIRKEQFIDDFDSLQETNDVAEDVSTTNLENILTIEEKLSPPSVSSRDRITKVSDRPTSSKDDVNDTEQWTEIKKTLTSTQAIPTRQFSTFTFHRNDVRKLLPFLSINSSPNMQKRNPRKRVLVFTTLFGKKTWRDTPRDYKFTEVDGTPCAVDDCELTYDKYEINTTDAVYFDGRDLSDTRIAYLRQLRRVNPNQLWVWLMHESPAFIYYNATLYDEFFNWTASYKPSSQVFVPYFGILKLTVNDIRPADGTNFAAGKDKKVLVIISHCDEYRMNMIRTLKRYIDVDIYGACKDFFNPNLPHCVRKTEHCDRLQARYKFYLAIENSYCSDYITEKYYLNGLKRHIVPVVLTGGNFSNTDIILPHSYINILDFKDMRNLGTYLNYLDSNDTAYNEYHAWSFTHRVDLRHGMCKLCKALWEHDVNPKPSHIRLSEVWNADRDCLPYKNPIFQKYLL